MNLQEIQAEKLSLISWIAKLQDMSTISQLKSIQKKQVDIPQWQKDLVMERIDTAKPEDYISWERQKEAIDSGLDDSKQNKVSSHRKVMEETRKRYPQLFK